MTVTLTRPLPEGVGTQTDAFGWRAGIPGVIGPQLHTGQDWAAPHGTPVYAAHTGIVRHAGWDPLPGLVGAGYAVKIGAAQCSTVYMHLAGQPLVRPGDYVTPGQPIGYLGSTGNSTGPHLHFELHLPGGPVDPRPYIRKDTPMTESEMDKLAAKVVDRLLATGIPQHGVPGTPKLTVRDILGKAIPLARRAISYATLAAKRQ